jgi:choline dehydrogenase-like flavoprotein
MYAVDPAYLQTDFDLSVLIAVSQGARRLWAAAPLAGYREPELVPGYSALPLNASDAVWATYIRSVYTVRAGCSLRLESLTRLVQPVYHPIGTASMLPRADGGAVDTAFKLYGTTNVRVVGEQALLAAILVECVAQRTAQMRPSCRSSSRRTYPRLCTASRRRRQG